MTVTFSNFPGTCTYSTTFNGPQQTSVILSIFCNPLQPSAVARLQVSAAPPALSLFGVAQGLGRDGCAIPSHSSQNAKSYVDTDRDFDPLSVMQKAYSQICKKKEVKAGVRD